MDTDQTLNKHEMSSDMLSALADGQLRGAAFAQAVDRVLHDDAAQATWHRYHLIGDVLRSGELARCDGDSAFLARLQGRLKQEPGFARPVSVQESAQVLAAEAAVRVNAAPVTVVLPVAANEPAFRWKMVAGFASMAAVAAIGWNLIGAPGMPGALPSPSQQIALVSAPTLANVSSELAPMAAASPIQLVQFSTPLPAVAPAAQSTQAVTLNGESQVMIRDKRLDELLAAHKQFGGTSALQMPAGFLRNATFDVPAR